MKHIKNRYHKFMAAIFLCAISGINYADSVIPIPDPAYENKGWLQVISEMFIKYGAPLLVYGGAIVFLMFAGFGIYRGYQNYQKTEEFSTFKTSLIGGAIIATVGILLFSTGGTILDKWTAAAGG